MKRIFLLSFLILFSFGITAAYTNDELQPITPENASRLQEIERLGQGRMNSHAFAWMPNSEGFAIGGSRGFWLYASIDSNANFVELGRNIQAGLFSLDGTILFLSDGQSLIAYDIENQTIRYEIEGGMRPLAISHDGAMLAYERAMSVGILNVETGDSLYELSYEGILEDEASEFVEGWYQENSFVFAQFSLDDMQLIIGWTSLYIGGWEGRTDSSYDVWDIASQTFSRPREINAAIPRYQTIFALDEAGDYFVLSNNRIISDTGEIELANSEDIDVHQNDYRLSQFSLSRNLVAFPYYLSNVNDNANRFWVGVWDIQTGEQIASYPHQQVFSLSPDGNKIAIGLEIYELSTSTILRELRVDNYELLQNSPERSLLYGTNNTVQLFDTLTMEEIAILPLLRSHIERIVQQESYLFISDKSQQLAYTIELETGQIVAEFRSDTAIFSYLTFSPDGFYFVSNDANPISPPLLWNANTGEIIPIEDEMRLTYPYFHAETGAILLWGWQASEILLHALNNQSTVARFPAETSNTEAYPPPPPSTLVVGQDYLAILSNNLWDVWQVSSQDHVGTYGALFASMAKFSPNESYFAFVDETVLQIVRLADGSRVDIPRLDFESNSFRFVDDSTILINYVDNFEEREVYLSIETGELSNTYAFQAQPELQTESLLFFINGFSLTITDNDGNILQELELEQVINRIALSQDETRLYIDYHDGTIGIWAVRD